MAHDIALRVGSSFGIALSSGGGDTQLVISKCFHTQSADVPTLSQVHRLTLADAAHSQSADGSLILIRNITLVVGKAFHGINSDTPALVQLHILQPSDTVHLQVADNVALQGIIYVLIVSKCIHRLTSDNIWKTPTIGIKGVVSQDGIKGIVSQDSLIGSVSVIKTEGGII